MRNIITKEYIDEIAKRLAGRGLKDTQLPSAQLPMNGEEMITVVLNGSNRTLSLSDMITHFKVDLDSIDYLVKIGINGNWYINGHDTGFKALGKDGYTPVKGVDYFDGLEGKIGPTGKEGKVGPNGKDGLIGPRGYTGAQGEQGIQGVLGKVGPQGVQGKIGLTGPEGKKGATGAEGKEGKVGPIGLTGPRGLSFKYDDFTEEQLLLLKGATGSKGDKGEAFKVNAIGSLSSKNNFDSVKAGFAYLDVGNSHLYIKVNDTNGAWSEPVPFGKGDKGEPFKFEDFTEAQILDLKQPAIQASIDANKAKNTAIETLNYSKQLLLDVVSLKATASNTLDRTNTSLLAVSAAVNTFNLKIPLIESAIDDAEEATIIALNSKGPKGDPFRINAVGTLAEKSLHDGKDLGYCFLDYVGNKFYVKKSESNGDWTDGITFIGSVGNVNSEEYSNIDYENGRIHKLKDEGDPIYPITNPEAVIDERNNMTLRDHLNNIPVIEVLTESEFDSIIDKDIKKFYFIKED